MNKRPTSITVISWLLIVSACLVLISSMLSLNNPEAKEIMGRSPIPIPVQYAMMYAGLLVSLTSGIMMLKGKNWGRSLYVIWSFAGLIIGFATSPMKISMIPGTIVYLIIVFFLFRPKANEFFLKTGGQADA